MHPYIKGLSNRFEAERDPDSAAAMKKYMMGKFEYFGIKSPLRQSITSDHFKMQGVPDIEDIEPVVYDAWSLPEREFQYFAMELARKLARKAEVCRIDLYEYMAENKSWWDTIDFIASNLVGEHFKKYPDMIRPYTNRWMNSGNMWLQRVAILFQLKYRNNTDLELLTGFIERLAGSREFFINKAIGWILREYSKTDAGWVTEYVRAHEEQLAPLSKKEAFKWLEKRNKIQI